MAFVHLCLAIPWSVYNTTGEFKILQMTHHATCLVLNLAVYVIPNSKPQFGALQTKRSNYAYSIYYRMEINHYATKNS